MSGIKYNIIKDFEKDEQRDNLCFKLCDRCLGRGSEFIESWGDCKKCGGLGIIHVNYVLCKMDNINYTKK